MLQALFFACDFIYSFYPADADKAHDDGVL